MAELRRSAAQESAADTLARIIADGEAQLAAVTEQLLGASRLLDRVLLRAESAAVHADTLRALGQTLAASSEVSNGVMQMLKRTESLQAEWSAARRWTPAALVELDAELRELAQRRPSLAARRWIGEIADAIREREHDAITRLTANPPALGDEFDAGAAFVADGIRAWLAGSAESGLKVCAALAGGSVPGWRDTLDDAAKSRMHRVAAWFALRLFGDVDGARVHVDQAVRLDPRHAASHGDRAAFLLGVGNLEEAASEAQRAIELEPDDPVGYLCLGAWAEMGGDFDEADEMFRCTINRMTTHTIMSQPGRASLLPPPGRMLLVAAQELLRRERHEDALTIVDAALSAGIRGDTGYPDAEAHRVRFRALEQMPGRERDAARSAVDAGKRFHWNRHTESAITCLEQALALDPSAPEAGWYLADALIARGWPGGAQVPSADLTARARMIWESFAGTVGLPSGPSGWAYLTRAIIADFERYARTATRSQGDWEALVYVERALVHDQGLASAWGLEAKYLRARGLRRTALEAAERGYDLDPSLYTVLTERMALLAELGQFADASATAESLAEDYPEDPWLATVRAWLAWHEERYPAAIALLELPIARGHDPGWVYDQYALACIGGGDVDAARAGYRRLLDQAEPVDSVAKMYLTFAAAALRDRPAADRWFAELTADDSASPVEHASAAVHMAFLAGAAGGGDDGDAAATAALEEEIRLATSQREVDDALRANAFRVCLIRELPLATALELVDRLAGGAADRRRAQLGEQPVTADGELAAERLTFDEDWPGSELGVHATAVLAVQARRRAGAGDAFQAAALYERLAGSLLDPEAAIARVSVLEDARREAVARADVEAVRELNRRLAGTASPDELAARFALTAALVAAGRTSEARTELESIAGGGEGPGLAEAERRLADIAVLANDTAAAHRHLNRALEAATRSGDTASAAQIEIRIAMTILADGDPPMAAPHILAALEQWRAAGAYDPLSTMLEDLARVAVEAWEPETTDLLRRTVADLAADGHLLAYTAIDQATIAQALGSA